MTAVSPITDNSPVTENSPVIDSSLVADSSESFAALFEESLARQEMRIGELITAEIVQVDFNVVIVNAGLKS